MNWNDAQRPVHISNLEDHAIFHHGFHPPNVTDVRGWITIYKNHVSQFARRD